MECVINWTICKASKCQKKENYFRCLATPTVVFLHCIHNSVTFSRWVVVLDQGSWEACELVFSSLTFMDILSIGALFSHDKWQFPYLRLESAHGPNSAINPYDFWPKSSSAHFQLFPMINWRGFRSRKKSYPHSQLLCRWVSFVKIENPCSDISMIF